VVAARFGSLPFREQIAYFRGKQNIGTRAWTDISQEQHDHAFVVAGAMKKELLHDLRGAVDQVIEDGMTLEQFRAEFDDIVARHGWQYKGGRNWRSRVIYETNLRTSYQAGRFAQLTDPDLVSRRPFWMYIHSDLVAQPRQEHLTWDGLVLRHDDPWWSTHYPPNGWGCKCRVRPLSERQLTRLGKSGPDTAPPVEMETKRVGTRGPTPRTVSVPKGIDPGWAHTPGRSWTASMTPEQLDELMRSPTAPPVQLPLLPEPRRVPASRVMAPDLRDEEYVDAFLGEFGAMGGDRMVIFEDVAGELLVISDALFRTVDGTIKVGKRGRGQSVLLLADAIKIPDEIWVDWGTIGERTVLRRRYIAYFEVEGNDVPALAVYETGPQGWVGVTAFDVSGRRNLERNARRGIQMYGREE